MPARLAIQAWNLMGGIEWGAVMMVAELYGITDVDVFVRELVAIRSWFDSQKD